MRSLLNGILARGRNELKKHLNGGRLTFKQAILAKCYDCMGFYADGKADCAIPECPLYPVMPYGSKKTSVALETMKNGVAGKEKGK
jgi:hypothetical protein